MKQLLLAILLVSSFLLEGLTLIGDSFFVLIVLWAFLRDESEALLVAFLGGVVVSLISFQPIGLLSGVALGAVTLGIYLKRLSMIREKATALYVYGLMIPLVAHVALMLLQGQVIRLTDMLTVLIWDVLLLLLLSVIFQGFIGPKEKEPMRLRM